MPPSAHLFIIYASVCLLGFAMARTMLSSRFCIMGAMADVWQMHHTQRLCMFMLSIGVAALGTQVLLHSGYLNFEAILYAQQPGFLLKTLLGSLFMGVGMVLASGCPTQQMLLLGRRGVRALVVLLCVALSAQVGMSFNAQWGHYLEWIRLPAWRASPLLAYGVATTFIILGAYQLKKHKKLLISSIMVGAIIVALWWVMGVWAYVAQDPNTLDFAYLGTPNRQLFAASAVSPLAQLLDGLLHIHTTWSAHVFFIFGLYLGAWQRRSKASLPQQIQTQDLKQGLIGGAFMGLGGIWALGCTLGQGLSAASLLMPSSALSIFGFFIGVKLALLYLEKTI